MPFELNIRISSFLIWIMKGEINKQFGKEVHCGVLYYKCINFHSYHKKKILYRSQTSGIVINVTL